MISLLGGRQLCTDRVNEQGKPVSKPKTSSCIHLYFNLHHLTIVGQVLSQRSFRCLLRQVADSNLGCGVDRTTSRLLDCYSRLPINNVVFCLVKNKLGADCLNEPSKSNAPAVARRWVDLDLSRGV